MIVNKILGKFTDSHKSVDTVTIEWFERDKKRLRKISEHGIDIGIAVDEPLSDGDILFEDERNIIIVAIAPCEILKIYVSSMKEMGRACFELGNRHRSLAIYDDCIKTPYDDTDRIYFSQFGFTVEKVVEKFSGYTICKAHGNSEHKHSHHSHD